MKHFHLLSGCLFLLCLLCSCQTSQPSTAASNRPAATQTSTLTLPVLMKNSQNAMSHLKSLHVSATSTTQLIVNQNQAPTPTPLNQIQLTPFNTGTIQDGDTILPDQSSFHIIQTDAYASQELHNFFQIHLADKVYVQITTENR